jgi:hypothetical protein
MNEECHKLYKYRPLYRIGENGQKLIDKHTADIFREAAIYYSAPNSFNDPFDCNMKLSIEGCSKEDLDQYFSTLISEYPRADRRRLKSEISRARRNGSEDRFLKGSFEKTYDDYYNKSSVFCLSRKSDSIPMFSYYADSHRGIAIEFSFFLYETPCGIQPKRDFAGNFSFEGKIQVGDIDYHDKLPDLNFFRLYENPPALTRTLLFAKHHEWAHEKEFRIFRHKCGASRVRFPNKLITRVILGCKTGGEEISLVTEWLKDWPTPITISKATRAENAFALHIEDIKHLKAT